jgi:hypothetical protein
MSALDGLAIVDLRLAVSIGIPAFIAVIGWFLAHWLNSRREVNNKRREIRLRGLESAYVRLANAAQRNLTDQHKSELEAFVSEIQLYGTPRQIQLTIELVRSLTEKKAKISFDALLEDLRDTLRKELRMEAVSGSVWWYRFTLPDWARKPELKEGKNDDTSPGQDVRQVEPARPAADK